MPFSEEEVEETLTILMHVSNFSREASYVRARRLSHYEKRRIQPRNASERNIYKYTSFPYILLHSLLRRNKHKVVIFQKSISSTSGSMLKEEERISERNGKEEFMKIHAIKRKSFLLATNTAVDFPDNFYVVSSHELIMHEIVLSENFLVSSMRHIFSD